MNYYKKELEKINVNASGISIKISDGSNATKALALNLESIAAIQKFLEAVKAEITKNELKGK